MKETEHKKSESAYKEFEPHLPCVPAKKEPDLERLAGKLKPNYNHAQRIKPIESSEPQEKLKKGDAGFKWFTCPTCDGRGSVPQASAPSESQEEQEELWKEARHYIDVWRIEELFKRFTIRRNGDKD